MTSKTILLSTLLFLSPLVNAARFNHESYYQDMWCEEQNGEVEVTMSSGARADCITETHAVEFDFGDKWAEAIGQSLHYAQQTNKRAGIVLILEQVEDERFWERLKLTIRDTRLPIDVWFIGDGIGDLTFYSHGSAVAILNYDEAWEVYVPYIRDETGMVGDVWAKFKITIDDRGVNTELSEIGLVE